MGRTRFLHHILLTGLGAAVGLGCGALDSGMGCEEGLGGPCAPGEGALALAFEEETDEEPIGGCTDPDDCRSFNVWSSNDGPEVPDPENAMDLALIPRYAAVSGPCFGLLPQTCKLQSRTIYINGSGHQIESVTAYGKYFEWDMDNGNAPSGQNGTSLLAIARYAQGPCLGQPGQCVFDSRTVALINVVLTESVTAYNKYWNWNAVTGALISSGWLSAVPRYAQGPCQGVPMYGNCVFDSREIYDVPNQNGLQVEWITVGDRYWKYNLGTGALLDSHLLISIEEYTSPGGPCALEVNQGGDCHFDSFSVFMRSGLRGQGITR